ncbi:hypothetical protein CF8_3634 [Nocardioides sp. CF8]|uniref:hypothetical protein n=1 Tax=Nocardioides sp. CF8 TaxID=110319 RepID=UPI0003313236|nr:hypothetical protein [Nocardioides sp. CF8]EON22452.1 hypothetical protein CF8_3634 [Nocardioides sp. CF8]
MKWILVVVALASALVIGVDAVASRDENCSGGVAAPFGGVPGAPIANTSLDALGPHLGGAEEITRDHSTSKGFEIVVFRGYDADGDLMGRVVVEKLVGGWGEARVDMCER